MEISKKEFDELYGYVEVEFSSYYKFSFVYKGTTNSGDTVVLTIGGGADDIYKLDVTAGEKVKVKDFEARYAAVYEGEDYDIEIHSYSDW